MNSKKDFRIFLGGTFRTPTDKKELEKVYNQLTKKSYSVWWAPKQVMRGYDSDNMELLEQTNRSEQTAIQKSHLFVGVMRRATFGTAFEIKEAFDWGIPIIGYLLTNHPDFQSGSFRYRVRRIVKDDEELLEAVEVEHKKIYDEKKVMICMLDKS